MAISTGGGDSGAPMSDINTTPLVDVMLVLLIIFLIAIPVVIQSVELTLPKTAFEPTQTKPENVLLAVRGEADGTCGIYWLQTRVGAAELLQRATDKLQLEIDKQGGLGAPDLELPEAHIRGDINAPYRCIGAAIYTMQSAGFVKVGFISEPKPGTATN